MAMLDSAKSLIARISVALGLTKGPPPLIHRVITIKYTKKIKDTPVTPIPLKLKGTHEKEKINKIS
jgi:hypothetical protein